MATAADKLKAEKAKNYKCEHDVERVHHLIAAANIMRDHPATSALAASLVRELQAMNLKQMELDEKEREAEAREASHAAAPAEEEEEKSSNPRSGRAIHR